jgi:hypothetical protein
MPVDDVITQLTAIQGGYRGAQVRQGKGHSWEILASTCGTGISGPLTPVSAGLRMATRNPGATRRWRDFQRKAYLRMPCSMAGFV